MVGNSVQAAVNGTATLEPAGAVSALSSGTNCASILNNSPGVIGLAGPLISGTYQQVGNIDSTRTIRVNADSDLTAVHIIQSALAIGGSTGNPGVVMIDASDASGNPLAESSRLALADSTTSNTPFGAGVIYSAGLGSASDLEAVSPGNAAAGGNPLPVPEQSTFALLGFGAVGLIGYGLRWRLSVRSH